MLISICHHQIQPLAWKQKAGTSQHRTNECEFFCVHNFRIHFKFSARCVTDPPGAARFAVDVCGEFLAIFAMVWVVIPSPTWFSGAKRWIVRPWGLQFNSVECRIADLINPWGEYDMDMDGQWISYPLNPAMSLRVWDIVSHSEYSSHENDDSGYFWFSESSRPARYLSHRRAFCRNLNRRRRVSVSQ